ncbi:alpha/beta hydrolase [Lipingzhangella sp. LS1_29]|uniref:Alpha/beta hydrolase n=1 Tax=Lipingzhangella rawalii TaxID=2055835 RepID=A0ABU2HB57_9ACTN|nr:alpha/beta hydrolase [Lipingzhangella rawalii]MDS1272561.1 alpha/beta hydrolase [Lipingzhangella rawalii]
MATTHLTEPRRTQVRSADGTRINVEVRGPDDGTTVVLAHCWATSLDSWAPVVRQLPPDLRVVLYDQRGHGRSEHPPASGYHTTALADDLCAVLDETTNEPAIVCGHSIGGMSIMAAAPRPAFRTRVAAALLANTGCTNLTGQSNALPVPKALSRGAAAAFLRAPAPLGPANPVTAAALRHMTMGPAASPEAVRACAQLVHRCSALPRARWGHVLSTLELSDQVRELTVPTMVLSGNADRFTPPWHARRLAELLPHLLGVVHVPDIGHMGPLEAPAELARVINQLATTHTPSRNGTASAAPETERAA